MQLPNPLLMVSRKSIDSKPVADPRLMYKWGEQPRYIHNVDAAGWLAQGWTYEEQLEPPAEPTEEPAEEKRSTAKTKKVAES